MKKLVYITSLCKFWPDTPHITVEIISLLFINIAVLFRNTVMFICQSTKLRFLDTLSLHMCVSGLTTYQRTLWNGAGNGLNAAKKKRERPNGRDEVKFICAGYFFLGS